MSISASQAEELKQRLDAGESLFLLDVREEHEFEISNIGGHLIPLGELPARVQELDAGREIIALCKMGTRSAKGPVSEQSRILKCSQPNGRDSRMVGSGGPESAEILAPRLVVRVAVRFDNPARGSLARSSE
jgi:hypothetical protein